MFRVKLLASCSFTYYEVNVREINFNIPPAIPSDEIAGAKPYSK